MRLAGLARARLLILVTSARARFALTACGLHCVRDRTVELQLLARRAARPLTIAHGLARLIREGHRLTWPARLRAHLTNLGVVRALVARITLLASRQGLEPASSTCLAGSLSRSISIVTRSAGGARRGTTQAPQSELALRALRALCGTGSRVELAARAQLALNKRCAMKAAAELASRTRATRAILFAVLVFAAGTVLACHLADPILVLAGIASRARVLR